MSHAVSGPQLIAIAVVEFEDQFLIGRRADHLPLGGLWEFPGGKVLPHECPQDAAVRECREETSLEVEVVGEYPPHDHTYEHGAVRLQFFACRPCDPTQTPRPPFGWVARQELAKYAFPAGNGELLKRLLAQVSSS